MKDAFPLRPLVQATAPGFALPPRAKRIADYGLAFDRERGRIVYAPSLDYHTAGSAWSFDGETWSAYTAHAVQCGSIEQPWRAVWDASREAVVLWSWDYGVGAIGVVLDPDAPKARVLTSDAAFKSYRDAVVVERLEGSLPRACTDTDWQNCGAIFGHDERRAVTVCVNPGGLWELAGTEWRHVKGVDLATLPMRVDGQGGALSNGMGAVYDDAHAQIIFWAHDHDARALHLVAWDGRGLTRVSTEGLPKRVWSFGPHGFAVGDHPSSGLVVLVDGELFAMRGAAGGFTSRGWAQGAPPPCKAGLLASDPARALLLLGPFHARGDEHRMFVLRDDAWSAHGRKIEKSALAALGDKLTFVRAAGAVFAVNRDGAVARWIAEAARWEIALSEGEVKGIEAPLDVIVRAWGGRLHAVGQDGAVFRLDDGGAAPAWTRVVPKSKSFGASRFPLAAFDEERGVLVVWGSEKKTGGRRDETFLCDGKGWSKAKPSRQKPPGADGDEDPFTLFYWPEVGAVVRTSAREIALFDGHAWSVDELARADLAPAWSQTVCVGRAPGPVVFVKRHASEQIVVRLTRGKAGYAMEKLGTFATPAARDEGENAAFDQAWFDEEGVRLVAHFDDDDVQTFAMDLASAFA